MHLNDEKLAIQARNQIFLRKMIQQKSLERRAFFQ